MILYKAIARRLHCATEIAGPRSRTGGLIQDGTGRLSRNVGNYRPTDAA